MLKWLLVPPTLVVLFFLLVVRRIANRLRILRTQLAAYRRGDYQGQLQAIEGFRVRGSEPVHYLGFRGSACYQLGRLEEAEQALRRSLSMEKYAQLRTVTRDELGRVLMEQGRWDDAAACFQECIAESPQRGGSYRSVAELLLRRGHDRTAALDAARRAEAADRAEKVSPGKLGKEDHDLNLSESLAVLAWALAQNGTSPAEIEPMLKEAFSLCPETTRPTRAEIHYFAGRAYADLGKPVESERQFRTAVQVDPVGNYGRLCESAITAMAH
jgi:tetratricopeptide (TPR) repeat protein